MNLSFTFKFAAVDICPVPLSDSELSQAKYVMPALNFNEKLKLKIARRRSRFPKHAKLGHSKLLFCRRQQRNVQRLVYSEGIQLLLSSLNRE